MILQVAPIWWQPCAKKRDVEVATANPPYAISANEDGSISDPWALALLRECSQEKFDLVVPGSESGVSIAEWVSAELGLPHNGREKICHRRHKQGMIDVAHQYGLRAPRSVTLSPASAQDSLYLDPSLVKDCVVKPVGSGAVTMSISAKQNPRLFKRLLPFKILRLC